MRLKQINYWDKEMLIEFDEDEFDITIKPNGNIQIEHEGRYYGPSTYWYDFDVYDLCGLLALWDEVYGEN